MDTEAPKLKVIITGATGMTLAKAWPIMFAHSHGLNEAEQSVRLAVTRRFLLAVRNIQIAVHRRHSQPKAGRDLGDTLSLVKELVHLLRFSQLNRVRRNVRVRLSRLTGCRSRGSIGRRGQRVWK